MCNPDKEIGSEATDPVGYVQSSKGDIKRDVKLTSDVKCTEIPKVGDFHLVFDHTRNSPFHLRRDRYNTERGLCFGLGRIRCQKKIWRRITLVGRPVVVCIFIFFFFFFLKISCVLSLIFVRIKETHGLTCCSSLSGNLCNEIDLL